MKMLTRIFMVFLGLNTLPITAWGGHATINELDGARYTITNAKYHEQGWLSLVNQQGPNSATFAIDFNIAGRPYQCLARLSIRQNGRLLVGTAGQCRYLDNGQTNPTTCQYNLQREGLYAFEGPSVCYGIKYTVRIE